MVDNTITHGRQLMSKQNQAFIILLVFIALSVSITFSYILTMRYELKTGAADGLSFVHTLFNFLNGRGLSTTIAPPYVEQSWLGVHFSPILYILSLVYYFFPYIETLLAIQSFFIASAAIPIFFISKTFLKSHWYALLVSIFYLLNPFVINAQIWDFHEIAFAPLVISLILWSVVNKNKIWLCIFCTILLTIKEHYGLAVFGTGLLWAYYWREPKFGLIIAALGLLAFFIVIKIIMPYFNPLGSAAMLNDETGLGFFTWLHNPLQDSKLLVKQVINAIFYCILLVSAFWFQPIFSPIWLLPSMADMAANTLSTQELMRTPHSYHTASIIPVLLVAYVKTISARYSATTKLKLWEMLSVTALMVVAFSYFFAALPTLPNNIFEFSKPRFSLSPEDDSARREIIKIIGHNSSVAAQFNILTHIPLRKEMYIFPNKFEGADYIVLNTRILFEKRPIFFEENYFTATKKIMNDKNWKLLLYQNNWLLFKKTTNPDNIDENKTLLDLAKKDFLELETKTKEHNDTLRNKKNGL